MPIIKFSDDEFEHLSHLLSAEIESTISYVKLMRSLIPASETISKDRIKSSQPVELPEMATTGKPAKHGGRPPKSKPAGSGIIVTNPVSQPNGLKMLRLEDDFIARTALSSKVDPAFRKKKRRRRSKYRSKGITLTYLGKPMGKDQIFKR